MERNTDKIAGLVFNIQKFSLNDGPGIRTVVFLKGCPLRCKWCSNPESQSAKIQVLWDGEHCRRCGTCVNTCERYAVSMRDNTVLVDHSLCLGCEACVKVCPGQALKTEGKWQTVDEVMTVCMQDVDFYEESGGGVTLSGGEAMMHPEFSLALLKALKEKNIHTAMETTGFAPEAVFASMIPYLDLLLFDMKHWQEEAHKEGTGVSNQLILRNMQLAIEAGKEVLPRLPVIPGYNNSPEDAKGFVRRLRQVGGTQIQLLPFHQFGEKKYDMLNREYAYSDVPALHEQELQEFQRIFTDNGIHAFF